MKTTGLKTLVVLLVAMLMAGLAFAGWGGGGRRGGGWYGPGPERGVQEDFDEQGPWTRRGPGWTGPQAETWQGGPGRERGGPYAVGPRGGRQGMGRGWGRGYDGTGGPGARFGRGGRAGRAYQGRDFGSQGQGWGRRHPMMQRQPMRGRWGQGFRGGRAGGGFRRGAGVTGGGGWNGPGRALQGRNFGPRGQGYRQWPMIQRRPWGGQRGQGPRPGAFGRGYRDRETQWPGRGAWNRPDRGFQDRAFGPRGQQDGPGPMMQRRPMEDNRGQGFGPGSERRGFQRENAPKPEERGQGIDRPDRDDRPSPRLRGGQGRGWEDRPRLRRGLGGPAERPEEKGKDVEAPAEADKPKADPPESEGV